MIRPRRESLVEAEVAHDRGDQRVVIQPAALVHVLGAHVHYLVAGHGLAVFRPRPGSGRRRASKAKPTSRPFSRTSDCSASRCVEPHSTLMFRPSGLLLYDISVRAQGVEHALGYHPRAAVGAVEAYLNALVRVGGEAYEIADVAVASLRSSPRCGRCPRRWRGGSSAISPSR